MFMSTLSKAFDRVWLEDLIYKQQSLGISGLPLRCIESFLSNRFQSSSWLPVLAGVRQGCTLGFLLFLVLLMIYLKIYHQVPNSLQMILLFFQLSCPRYQFFIVTTK